MRILFLVTRYPSEVDQISGIFHRTACEALLRAGEQVEVLAPVPFVPWGWRHLVGRWKSYAAIPASYTYSGVNVSRPRYLQVPRGDWIGWSHRWYESLLRRASVSRPADVIHAHFAYPCGVAAANVGRELNIPTVLTLHGSDVNVFPTVSRRSRRLFCDAVNGVDHVLAVSDALAGRTKAITGRLPEVAPIGVDLRRFVARVSKCERRRQLGIPVDKFVLVTVGRLTVEKGLRELADALRALDSQNVVGVVVGEGPLLKELQTIPNAIAVGPVANERIPEYLAAADAFVLPSYSEGMPTVLIEAGAVGLPVLASAVGGIPELLGDDRGWVVPCRSSEAIVRGVSAICLDREGATRRASRLHEYVLENYDADRNAGRLANLYAAVASRQCEIQDTPK